MVDGDDRMGVPQAMSAAERARILLECNATEGAYPSGQPIFELFETQAARTPEAAAVIDEAVQLTYRELDDQSAYLAHELRILGAGPERIVGLCMRRSAGMVVAFLAILKAGAAYLPLDPAHPAERLQYLLADAAATLVVVDAFDAAPILPNAGMYVLTVEELWRRSRLRPKPHRARSTQRSAPTQVAYIVYTSGSTGPPKGVMAEHEAAVNGLSGQARAAPFQSSDRCAQKSSIGFVDSIFETLGPLLAGASLVVVPASVSQDPAQLATFIAANAITRIVTVPSLAYALIDQPQSLTRLGSLHTWLLSGEVLPAELLTRLQRALPRCHFTNVYGASEVAAFVTAEDAHLDDPIGGNKSSVSIGRPQQNVRVYILDHALQPVPVGEEGEIVVAGISLVRGYLNRPQQTADRFVADPYSPRPGGRMYRTGDLGRWRAGGLIDYHGRGDHQVKLRGFRIELGEIEATLLRNASVRRAAVILNGDPPASKRLVAYVEHKQGSPISVQVLRKYVSSSLPSYMVPSSFILLNELPMNAHGKIDRQRLPKFDSPRRATEFVAPASGTGQLLASIWSEVLQVEGVGAEDNFFELGGHSLLAAKLTSTISERFGVTITVPTLFASPTVRALATCIDLLLLVRELDGAGAERSER